MSTHGAATQDAASIKPANGKLGIMIPGMGAVATTLIAGVEGGGYGSHSWDHDAEFSIGRLDAGRVLRGGSVSRHSWQYPSVSQFPVWCLRRFQDLPPAPVGGNT